MKLKKLATAVAVASALGAGQAHADAFSEAALLISNFVFTNGSGTTLSVADFVPNSLNITDSLTNVANLSTSSPSFGFSQTSGFVASTDAVQACSGVCTHPENTFTIESPPLVSGSFARADSLLAGASITNPVVPTGTTANNIAETWINDAATGSDFSDMILTSSFQFTLAHDIATLGIDFFATAFNQAWTSLGSAAGTLAGSNINLSIVLSDASGTLISWTPGGGATQGLTVISSPCDLNDQASAPENSPSGPTVDCSGRFTAVSSIALAANHPYSFTITQHVATNATNVVAVPEPATLALLGIGLAGFGLARRRRA